MSDIEPKRKSPANITTRDCVSPFVADCHDTPAEKGHFGRRNTTEYDNITS